MAASEDIRVTQTREQRLVEKVQPLHKTQQRAQMERRHHRPLQHMHLSKEQQANLEGAANHALAMYSNRCSVELAINIFSRIFEKTNIITEHAQSTCTRNNDDDQEISPGRRTTQLKEKTRHDNFFIFLIFNVTFTAAGVAVKRKGSLITLCIEVVHYYVHIL